MERGDKDNLETASSACAKPLNECRPSQVAMGEQVMQ